MSVRQLRQRIKNNEYERLPEDTKLKLIDKDKFCVQDLVRNPIMIKNKENNEIVTEKILQKLILEDISAFLKELGNGFTFIDNEYKIKLGDRYNYIDLLLYNIKYKCYVVVELKVTELNSNHTGQIKKYMNYIDKNIKTIEENKTVNIEMISLYWNIGKMIVEQQKGNTRAKYGDLLIEGISNKLTENFGKGFSIQNLRKMRQFYMSFPIRSTLSSELSISHYFELVKIKDKNKRNFYMQECINSNWDVRELQRQRTTLLYERISTSKDKNKIVELANSGHKIYEGKDIIKDPFVLEILDIKENTNYLETDLEKNILEHLKEFLLELGKGFTFVGNQVRVTIDTEHYYPDLVFYNRILQCFVIIDLKIGKVTHKDIGQMQMYVNYYDRNIKSESENKTIGILLSTDKNETIVKYTLPEDNKTIFSSEFRLTIPSEQEFIDVIENEKKNMELV